MSGNTSWLAPYRLTASLLGASLDVFGKHGIVMKMLYSYLSKELTSALIKS